MKPYNPLKSCLVCGTTVLLFISQVFAGQWKPVRSLIHNDGDQVLVRVVEQRDEVITLQYEVPSPRFSAVGYQTRNGRTAQRIELGNTELVSEPGKPEIPCVTARVILPRGRLIADVSVIPGDIVILPDKYLLSHGEIPHKLSSAKVTWSQPDPSIYESDAAYPGRTHDIRNVQYCFGVAIAPIDIYPITYLPKSGTLSYFKSFTLRVKTKVDTGPGTGVRVRLGRFANRFLTEDNPGMLGTYTDGELRGEYEHVLCDPGQTYSYLLITGQSVIDATTDPGIDDLIAQRELKGFTCKVEAIENITKFYNGRDEAEDLRNYIKDAYNNWNTEFVTLGGDINIIPLETVRCSNGGSSDDLPSDLPYQCLDQSTWNDDFEAEVMIGRLSGEDATEISNQIFKILKYETDPSTESYLQTGLSLGEKLDDRTYAKDAMLELRTYFSDDWTFDGLFDKDGSWSKSELIQKINTNAFSNIDHFGHCNTSYAMKMRNGDEDDLTNTNYIFVKSQGCIPGAFDRDCFAERFTTENKIGGMFSVVMNSRYGWYAPGNPTGGSSHKLHRSFWKACWEQEMTYFSEFNEYSHRMNSSREWDVVESNLFGCAATPFRGKEVPPFVQVLSPNGGEKWEVDRTFTIVWDDNIDDNVKIELLKGTTVKEELAASVPSSGSWEWQIPADFELADDYKIRITCVVQDTLTDESDAAFTVEEKSNLAVTSPNGGEILEKGSDVEITWDDNLSGEVRIDLYRAGKIYDNIVSATPSNGSYTWTIPDIVPSGNEYTICVTSIEKDWLNDESDDSLSIQNPTIKEFPYVQDFDDFDTGTVPLRQYWEQLDDDDLDWTVLSGPTPSQKYQSTGPKGDHTSGNGIYIYCEASGNNNPSKKMNVITPMFDFKCVRKPVLTFWAHMKSDSNTMGDLYLDIWSDGAWEQEVIHLTDNHGDPWFENTLDMIDYEGKVVQFKFRGVTGASWCSDICVDDFTIEGDTNQVPVFTSTPVTAAKEGEEYAYTVEASDGDGDTLIFGSTTLPAWLTLTDNGDGTAELKGTPQKSDVGDAEVVLTVTDGFMPTPVEQVYTIKVAQIVEIIHVVNVNKERFKILPNPAPRSGGSMQFTFPMENVTTAELCVYDALGGRLFSATLNNSGEAVWNLVNEKTLRQASDEQFLAVLWVTYKNGTIEQIRKSIGILDE